MSTLTSELEKLRALLGTLPTRRVLPANQMRPTRRALERIQKAWDVSMQPPVDRLEQAKRAIIAAQRSGTGLSSLSPRVLRDAVWLFWSDTDDRVNRQDLRGFILNRIGTDSAMLRRLIDTWLLWFDRDDDSFVDVGKQIDRYLVASQAGLLALWRESNRAYDIFNAVSGPDRLASRITDDPSDSVLAAYRLDIPSRASSGYLRAVHLALSAKLPKALREDSALDIFKRATRFYTPNAELRFDEPGPNGAMANGLVGAWLRTQRQPSDRLKKEVLTYLRQHLGDPRVDSRNRWAWASDETRQTVRGWLSALSLDAFFHVVGSFAGSAGMGHQWKARQAFWGACLRGGHIRDSWLVLGDNVAGAVSGDADLRGSYGRLDDGDPNHSVLLMQIGDLIFSEWTYNGKLRAWPVDWKNAPRLFRSRYRRLEVVGSCLQFPPPADRPDLPLTKANGVSHTPVWQGRVAALLRRKEGIVLNPSDWRVR